VTNIWPLQRDAAAFYGEPWLPGWLHDCTIDVPCPWPLRGCPQHILIHKKCRESLYRVLNAIWDAVGHNFETIQRLRYDRFDGSYCYRPIRGGDGRHLSMHSYAAALDFDAEDNQQHSQHHLFQDDSLIVKCFEAEGWIWGGRWSPGSIDSMHFQAVRIHS